MWKEVVVTCLMVLSQWSDKAAEELDLTKSQISLSLSFRKSSASKTHNIRYSAMTKFILVRCGIFIISLVVVMDQFCYRTEKVGLW
jgi:hypothetical protein